MTKARQAILAGILLAAMGSSPAFARDDDRTCFSQRTSSGTVKICAGDGGAYEFGIKSFGDQSDKRDYDWNDRDYNRHRREHRHTHYYPAAYQPIVVYPASFVPPGHRKRHGHGHHDCHH